MNVHGILETLFYRCLCQCHLPVARNKRNFPQIALDDAKVTAGCELLSNACSEMLDLFPPTDTIDEDIRIHQQIGLTGTPCPKCLFRKLWFYGYKDDDYI